MSFESRPLLITAARSPTGRVNYIENFLKTLQIPRQLALCRTVAVWGIRRRTVYRALERIGLSSQYGVTTEKRPRTLEQNVHSIPQGPHGRDPVMVPLEQQLPKASHQTLRG
ncbi:hypothetical protein CC1G_14436 [Coprinopsis cinerea okayama7|uniref:Uncharacterized protein n=1 Tax=Coprinopsis cinerea (strain Okayama-7 / 130 / ATCC MYA-4618 / FGSC 9003) TaxID=240176 RepID=D6RMC0_COPC7|nr:hypothetical protein CC1G_14436 [Coprinopsis cinerea okayama7\|eukprot:XP_002911439.1 hypothetical protein CC1G_14436 [Coprinopsis cinerea okayama7\